MAETRPTHKQRDIRFCQLHPDPSQAESAVPMVAGMEGVHHSEAVSSHHLAVGYDVVLVTLRQVEERLSSEGYHLDNSLLTKLKRALYYYTEENERALLGVGGPEANTQVFVKRYERLRHGCRDERPEHWRNYL